MTEDLSFNPVASLSVQAQSLQLLCALAQAKTPPVSLAHRTAEPVFRSVFLEQLYWHQLAPLIDLSNPQVASYLTGDLPEVVSKIKMQLAANALKYCNETVSLFEYFSHSGIRVLSLKGPALSQQLYGSPVKRHIRDIDLFVSIEDVPGAVKHLSEIGYECESSGFLVPDFYSQYTFLSKDISFYHPGKDIILELHWRLMNNPSLMPLVFEEAWAARVEVVMNNAPIPVLGPLDSALHLACHGCISHWGRMKWVADWHQLQVNDRLDWSELFERASEIGKEICIQNAFDNARYWFGETAIRVPPEFNSRRSRRLLPTNRCTQLHCKYPSVGRGVLTRLLMANSIAGIWQEYRRSLGTSVADIKACRLPNRLFFLYYLLRPAIYLARKLGKTNAC